MVFLAFYILIAIIAVIQPLLNRSSQILGFVILAYMLFAIAIFGQKIGGDAFFYKNYFLYGEGSYEYIEFGFSLFTKLIRLFTNNYNIYFAIIAIVINISIVKIAAKYSPYFLMVALVYFSKYYLPSNFQTLRQAIAGSILLFSFCAYLNGKKVKFTLLVCLAAAFHISSLIYFLVLILEPKLSGKRLFYGAILAFVFSLALNVLLRRIAFGKLAVYITGTYSQGGSIFTLLAIILVAIFTYRPLLRTYDSFRIWKIYSIGVLLYIALFRYGTLAFRISRIFTILEIVMIPTAIYLCKRKKFAYCLMIAYSLIYFLRWNTASTDFIFKLIK